MEVFKYLASKKHPFVTPKTPFFVACFFNLDFFFWGGGDGFWGFGVGFWLALATCERLFFVWRLVSFWSGLVAVYRVLCGVFLGCFRCFRFFRWFFRWLFRCF